jgi:hypothetical protein
MSVKIAMRRTMNSSEQNLRGQGEIGIASSYDLQMHSTNIPMTTDTHPMPCASDLDALLVLDVDVEVGPGAVVGDDLDAFSPALVGVGAVAVVDMAVVERGAKRSVEWNEVHLDDAGTRG